MTPARDLPITGIDHTLVGVADLEAARAAYARLGFTATPRGRHIGWATGNYCLMFPDDYVELLGIVEPGGFSNGLDRRLAERGEGLLGLAFSGDSAAVHAALAARGLAGGLEDLGRLTELPEGAVTPRFRLARFAAGATPGLSAFVCQHLTPGLMRRPAWLDHANGAVALEGVTLRAEDPPSQAEAWARLFGANALRTGAGRLDVTVGRHRLTILSPGRLARRYPGLLEGAGDGPCVMTFTVADLGRTRSVLDEAGVAVAPLRGRRLVVGPAEACGVVVEFAEPEAA